MTTFEPGSSVFLPDQEDAILAVVKGSAFSPGDAGGVVETEGGEVHELTAAQTAKLAPADAQILEHGATISDLTHLVGS